MNAEETPKRTDAKPRMRVLSLGLADTAAPLVGKPTDFSTKQEGFIKCGRHNLFFEFCRALADNCSPLNASIEMMARYIAGEGIEFVDEDGELVEEANDWWHNVALDHTTEEEFLFATALDIALTGTYSWLNRPSRARLTEELRHVDVTRLRMSPKVNGRVENYKWSANWEEWGKKVKVYQPEDFKAFEVAMQTDAGILYGSAYKQTRDYYGEPWWLPAIADSEVMARVPIFNRTQLDTGFRPAFHLHIFDNRDDIDLSQIDEQIEHIFTGVNGKTYMVTNGPLAEGAPVLNKLERGDHAGELDKMGDTTEERIYRAYGIPKILMGIDTKTGLQGQGLAVEQTLAMFERTMVRPKKQLITAKATRLAILNGYDNVWQARIKPLVPFDQATDAVLQRQTYLRRLTVNEDRIANGMEPLPPADPRGNLLLIEAGSQGLNDNADA